MNGSKGHSRSAGRHSPTRRSALAIGLCWVQGLYFFVLGVWPLISIDTFQAVTGRKTDHLVTGRESDHWLVNTVGALIAVIGAVLLCAAWRRKISVEVALLGMSSALALTAIDIIYVVRETISPIYLADGAIEIVFAGLWGWCCRGISLGGTQNCFPTTLT